MPTDQSLAFPACAISVVVAYIDSAAAWVVAYFVHLSPAYMAPVSAADQPVKVA
jgi:hypothetical protein